MNVLRTLILFSLASLAFLIIGTPLTVISTNPTNTSTSHIQLSALGCRIEHPLEASSGYPLTYNITLLAVDRDVVITLFKLWVFEYSQPRVVYGGAGWELYPHTKLIENKTMYARGEPHISIIAVTPEHEGYIYLKLYLFSKIEGEEHIDITEIFATTVRSPTYSDLEESYSDLKSKYEIGMEELSVIRNLMYIFIIITIIFISITVYFIKRRPKIKTQKP